MFFRLSALLVLLSLSLPAIATNNQQGVAAASARTQKIFEDAIQKLSSDPKKGVLLMQEAANEGHADAQFNIGLFYQNGTALPQDIRQAAYWYEKAGRQGLAKAQVNLGLLYEHVANNYHEAAEWYKMAAAQNDPMGMHNLGALYACGWGVPYNPQLAEAYLSRSASAGVPESSALLRGLRSGAQCAQVNPAYR